MTHTHHDALLGKLQASTVGQAHVFGVFKEKSEYSGAELRGGSHSWKVS